MASENDEYIGNGGASAAFPAVGVVDLIVQGLTTGSVKVQYKVPKTDLLTNPSWVDYPGMTFSGDTYRQLSLSGEGVYLRVVGIDNNAGVYVRFRKVVSPANWIKGDKGDPGEQGPAGTPGGPPGPDGASAYELAVINGFTGTVAEWLASLVGPQGPAGTKPIYFGTGDPPDPTGLEEGTLYFQYSI